MWEKVSGVALLLIKGPQPQHIWAPFHTTVSSATKIQMLWCRASDAWLIICKKKKSTAFSTFAFFSGDVRKNTYTNSAPCWQCRRLLLVFPSRDDSLPCTRSPEKNCSVFTAYEPCCLKVFLYRSEFLLKYFFSIALTNGIFILLLHHPSQEHPGFLQTLYITHLQSCV